MTAETIDDEVFGYFTPLNETENNRFNNNFKNRICH